MTVRYRDVNIPITRYARRKVRQTSAGMAYATGFSKTIILFIETGVLITASQVGHNFILVMISELIVLP